MQLCLYFNNIRKNGKLLLLMVYISLLLDVGLTLDLTVLSQVKLIFVNFLSSQIKKKFKLIFT